MVPMNVKGYMLRTKEMIEEGKEQLFAVGEHGNIMTCIKKYSSNFYEVGSKWEFVSELPEDAQFIGNYKFGGNQ